MRKAWIAMMGAVLLGGGLGGCSLTGTGDGDHPLLASVETPAAPGAAPPVPGAALQVSMGPFLEGPIGTRLALADRDSAFKAETDALSSGDRKTWRGQKGTYGFVVPGAADATHPAGDAGAGECRSFTHTIYFAGRPQVGHGTGCREADGSWRITG